MMKKRNRSLSRLGSALCCALGSGVIVPSCTGTETDNPVAGGDVFEGTSPENFTPDEGGVPPCVPVGTEQEVMLPRWLAQSVVVPSASGRVLASGSYGGGLRLIDASDPANPVELSRGVVQGAIHQLLLASSGELWVLATEPPTVDRSALPSATALDPVLKLVRVDVSDPAEPVRVADATLDGEPWELRERDGEAWVLSARRSAAERECSARENLCGYRSYEAVQLAGFRSNGAALEPIATTELPFELRAWWGSDGVVTLLADGTLHATGWDGSGALRAVRELSSGGAGGFSGPVEVAGSELSVVRVQAGQARIDVYDLAPGAAAPTRSTPLGPHTERAGIHSLFAEQHLWLQAPYGEIGPNGPASAELWDLTGGAPARIALPRPFHTVLPISGATREGQTDEILAIGASIDDASGGDELTLLSIRDGVVLELEATDPNTLNINRYQGAPAPAGVKGAGDAPAWVLRMLGLGLQIGMEPALSATPAEPRFTTAFVGVPADARAPGTTPPSYGIAGVALVEGFEPGRGIVTALELSGATPERRIELSAQMRALVATATGVVTVATAPASQCEQAGVECTDYAPGVSVFELTGEPRLVATLPFPELPLPAIDDPNRLSIRWDLYDPLTQQEPAALELGDRQLAFVAQVYLTCDNQPDCDALEITTVPIREANVAIGTPAACPPTDVDPDCDSTPPPVPTVYGVGQRQYFYVLDLDAPAGPAWEAWGVSRLEATAARTDRESRFAFPLATDGVLAATRLERRRSATDLNDPGATRFYLDRFERSEAGDIVALPSVNVPGYPVARLGGNAALERWLSLEAAPGETGAGRLHRMNVQSDGARIEQTLDLGGNFAGFRDMRFGARRLGLVLLTPDDGCGTTELSSIALGSEPADPSEPLGIAHTLELPSNGWQIQASDGDLALLQRYGLYVLVRVAADGSISLVSSSALDVSLGNHQLLGTTLFGAYWWGGPQRFDLAP
jgi:hypothetical protein